MKIASWYAASSSMASRMRFSLQTPFSSFPFGNVAFSADGFDRRIPASARGLGIGGKWVGKPVKPVNPASPLTLGRRLKLNSLLSVDRNGLTDMAGPLLDRAVARVVAVALLCCCCARCRLCQMAAECSCAFLLSSATLAPKSFPEFSMKLFAFENGLKPEVTSSLAPSLSLRITGLSGFDPVFCSGIVGVVEDRSGRRGGQHGQGRPDSPGMKRKFCKLL